MTYFIQIFFCILLFGMIPFVTDFFDDNLKNEMLIVNADRNIS